MLSSCVVCVWCFQLHYTHTPPHTHTHTHTYAHTHTQSEDTVKRAAQHKKKCYEKNHALKNTYDNRCKEADKMEENSNKLHANPQTKPNTLTQVQVKGQHM